MPFKPVKRILIVEDDKDTCEAYQHILQAEGYNTLCVSSGDEALYVLDSEGKEFSKPFDLCILDLVIPGKTGDEVSKIIKYERKMLTPILIVTGVSNQQLRKYEPMLRMVQGFLAKPFDIEVLLTAVKVMTLDQLSEKSNQAQSRKEVA